ncbi:EXOSOME COMPLEX EXONUCLEASE RIBOSOMAL RNA PROCESSING PROTEIN [Anaeramoeba flamelloides]|uniref:Ribosomal RNA-processing protein 42 n=1 Tax=Anaeramoeba flamelloides TaxID=1746091 RepID=A0AAV7YVJ7_9EUKA|nr:EXOSOME COMPLEX EXONUCLEASE RIBOSOMAL RNA PROCESSING PROTEIN [Anaeramoeba flamelloides]KAJ6246884.1 EXOSOME COMPLEX EXONUCLEASE RIBOSOMAL RNA PROCESSING PROTEIN [Anaeramoeba flamelloides]
MKNISGFERRFIVSGLKENIRSDGREMFDYRDITLQTGNLPQTNGSSLFKLGNTHIITGVKVEIGEPLKDHPNEGRLEISVECCPSASPEFEGRGAEDLNSELSGAMNKIINTNSALDLKSLCILERKKCWIIYIDVLVLDSDGNLFDSVSMGINAALSDVKIPKIRVVPGDKVGDLEIEVFGEEESRKLDTSKVPICITFAQIDGYNIVDPTIQEESCMSSRVTIAVNKNQNICGMMMGGTSGIDTQVLIQLTQLSIKIGPGLYKALDYMTNQNKTKLQQKNDLII